MTVSTIKVGAKSVAKHKHSKNPQQKQKLGPAATAAPRVRYGCPSSNNGLGQGNVTPSVIKRGLKVG